MKKNIKKNMKKKRVKEESSSEESEEDYVGYDDDDDEEYYDDDDDDDDEEFDEDEIQKLSANLIFSALGGGGQNPEELKDQKAIEYDPNEDCNSDDEKTFMRENYETIPNPIAVQNKRSKEQKKKKE